MQARPLRRSEGVVFERLDDGAVIYDGATKQAHSLDRAATRVFAAADGTRSAGDIAAEADLDESCVHAVLDQLGARGLLVAAPGVSRRGMLKRAGMVGAAAVAAAPLIETVIIPTAVAHASTMPTGSGGGGGGGAPTAYTIQLSGVMAQTLHWSFTSGSGANSSGDNLTLRSGLNWDSSGNATATDYVGSDIFQVTYFENNGSYVITGELLASLTAPFTAVFTDSTNPVYSGSWSGSDQVGTYVHSWGVTTNYPGIPAFSAPAGDHVTLTFTFSA